jgi:photosystem II stability/assembly factor-like uncharacterized protein
VPSVKVPPPTRRALRAHVLRATTLGCVLAAAGCLPDRSPPGDQGFFGGPRRPEAPEIPTPRPVEPPPSWAPTPHPQAPTGPDPLHSPTVPPWRPGDALPAPWPAAVFDVVAPRLARRVVASEEVVGLAALADGLLVIERRGGLFRADPFARFVPEVTPLPEVTRVFATGETLVACTPPAEHARFSLDGGRSWASLGFQCGFEGRRTVAGAGEHTYALVGPTVRVGTLPRGRARYAPLPIEAPEALGALDHQVIVFGSREVARSSDGGETFGTSPRPPTLATVRDVLFVGKGTVLAAGTAADVPSGSALARSGDGGLTWRPIPLPRRLDAIAALALRADGAVLAVPENARDGAALSVDAGRSFHELPSHLLAEGAALGLGSGLVAGSQRGLATVLGGRTPHQGLDQPLHAVAFTHPLVAVGIGTTGGLFHTRDGGLTWSTRSAWAGIRFEDVASPGDHTVVAVGEGLLWRSEDAGLTFDPRPLPSSCRVTWVRFGSEGQGLAGCRDGALLGTTTGGQLWRVEPMPPAPLQPVVFLEDGSRVALTATHRLATWTSDGWTLGEAPVASPIEVTAWRGGVSVLGQDGTIAVRLPGEPVWRGLPVSSEGVVQARRHRPLAGDAVLVLDARGLVVLSQAPARRLIETDALEFALTGDGGVLVLHDTATSLFSAR